MHILPGLNYYPKKGKHGKPAPSPLQVFWHPHLQKRYLEIMKQYESHVLFNLASHIHRAKFSAPISNQVEDMKLKTFISPSISPVYDNNPGFSILDIEFKDSETGFHINEITFHFYDLAFYQVF
jgi:hypothetical protein